MKQVCVLGNGQLGRMLRQAGEPLGIAVWPVGLDAEPAAVPFQQSVITAEIERWPETALTANWHATRRLLTATSSRLLPTV